MRAKSNQFVDHRKKEKGVVTDVQKSLELKGRMVSLSAVSQAIRKRTDPAVMAAYRDALLKRQGFKDLIAEIDELLGNKKEK